ncbi:MAG: sodium:proton antiporter [Deltaproteobacteria bacterium]|nr:sodium:proton antiporter [Deltaproteobacteria bacterium]
MSLYDNAAVLVALVAALGYFNHRVLKLPTTIGLVVIALVSSLVVLGIDLLSPSWHLREMLAGYVTDIDFNKTLMYGMLSFLLFAGALHTDLNTLLERRYTVALLATGGVFLSTFLVGTAAWLILPLIGLDLPYVVCLVFGALISPTDPIAVLGMLKRAGAPPRLSAIIAGESLFNDGVGVVLFIVLATVAGLSGGHEAPGAVTVAVLFAGEVGGGVVLGLVLGIVAYHALKSIDEHILEVQITLALVMLATVVSDKLHVSGPIAVVLAGLLLGNHGKRFAMSENTIDHMQKFWDMLDEILNAVLFLLIGLEVFAVSLSPMNLLAGAILVPVVLAARTVSVAIPVTIMGLWRSFDRGTVPILVWSGLRGGISVALVLSLPPFAGKDSLVTAVYVIVLFSILAQGLTVKPLVSRLLSRS